MTIRASRKEMHRSHRSGWLRAAVLGANDGVVSTASLIAGVAAAHATPQVVLLTGAGHWWLTEGDGRSGAAALAGFWNSLDHGAL